MGRFPTSFAATTTVTLSLYICFDRVAQVLFFFTLSLFQLCAKGAESGHQLERPAENRAVWIRGSTTSGTRGTIIVVVDDGDSAFETTTTTAPSSAASLGSNPKKLVEKTIQNFKKKWGNNLLNLSQFPLVKIKRWQQCTSYTCPPQTDWQKWKQWGRRDTCFGTDHYALCSATDDSPKGAVGMLCRRDISFCILRPGDLITKSRAVGLLVLIGGW